MGYFLSMETLPTIYSYSNPRDYVVQVLAFRKHKVPSFSLRKWSAEMGFKNPSYLSQVINGQRQLKPHLALKMANTLGLKGNERHYFEILVRAENSKNDADRFMYHEQLKEIIPKAKVAIELPLDRFYLISDWYHLCILEMLKLKDFCNDAKYISRRLGGKISPAVATLALDRLRRVGLIKATKEGKLATQNSPVHVGGKLASRAVQLHHEQAAELACRAIKDQAFGERDFSGSTISVKNGDFSKIKDLIVKFHQDLHSFEVAAGGDDIIRINVQCFKLTEKEASK